MPVRLSEHSAWFQTTLKGTRRLLWIVEPQAGMVRVDRKRHDDRTAWVSVYLVPLARGQGRGTVAIQTACRLVRHSWPELREVQAAIRTVREGKRCPRTVAGQQDLPYK